MSLVLNIPEPGQLVDVRQRRYVVVDVAQSVLPPDLLKSGSLSARLQLQQGQCLPAFIKEAITIAEETRIDTSMKLHK